MNDGWGSERGIGDEQWLSALMLSALICVGAAGRWFAAKKKAEEDAAAEALKPKVGEGGSVPFLPLSFW